MTGPRLLRREEPQAPHLVGAALHLWGCIGGCMGYKKLAPGEVYRIREIVRVMVDEQLGKDADERNRVARELLGEKATLGELEVIEAEISAYYAELKRLTDRATAEQAQRVHEAEKRGIALARKHFEAVGFVSEVAGTLGEQDRAMLAKLRALGYDPQDIPARPPNRTSPVKAEVSKALPWPVSDCDKTWKRLLKRKEIRYRSP